MMDEDKKEGRGMGVLGRDSDIKRRQRAFQARTQFYSFRVQHKGRRCCSGTEGRQTCGISFSALAFSFPPF